jgi:hypothetical protein
VDSTALSQITRQDVGQMTGRRSIRLASVFLGVPLAATVLVSLIRGTRHLASDWPVHAHHHLIADITGAVGLAVVSLLILIGPIRKRETWAWWALLVAGVAIYGGFWLGNAVVGLGEPGAVPNTAQAVLSALYLTGLVLAWRALGASSFASGDGERDAADPPGG